MALPSSGQLGMNQIRVELGIPSQSPFSLNTAITEGYVYLNECSAARPNAATPQTISEWYSYNHSAVCTNRGSFKFSSTSCADACTGPFTTTLYSCGLSIGNILRTTLISPGNYCGGPVSNIDGYYSNGTTCYQVSDQTIVAISSCPTPTPTPAPTATPTPTPTPSSGVTITVYTKQNTNGVGNGYSVYYRLNGCSGKGAWQQLSCGSCPTSDSCSACSGTISANSNQDISIAILDCSLGTGISFNASDNTSTCPSNAANYCDNADCTGTPFTFNSGTSNKNIAINVYTGKLGYLYCL